MKKNISMSDLVCVDTRIEHPFQGKKCIQLSFSGKGRSFVADIDISIKTARGLMDDLQRDLQVVELESIREELREKLTEEIREVLKQELMNSN